MTSKISIRQAVLTDVDALVPLFDGYRQFYGRESDLPGARAFLLARFNHGESTLFIAHDANAALGFAQLYPSFSSASLARTFVLNDLFVDEKARSQGVGKRLIGAAAAYAKTMGAIRMTLSTAKENEIAQALYLACDWKKDDQFFVYHRSLS